MVGGPPIQSASLSRATSSPKSSSMSPSDSWETAVTGDETAGAVVAVNFSSTLAGAAIKAANSATVASSKTPSLAGCAKKWF